MTHKNLYLTYKKDTSRLLYWVINTSNGIVKSGAHAEGGDDVVLNTTGQSTVAEIVEMCRLIAKHLDPIPTTILKLFQDVIKTRSTVYAAFQQMVNDKPDSEMERSNVTHKHFIDALSEAFHTLGGGSWEGSQHANTDKGDFNEDDIFENRFAALSLGKESIDDAGESSEDDVAPKQQKIQKKRTGKGKKGKRSKRSKAKPASIPPEDSILASIPIESYRIIEDKDVLVSEYLMAVYAVVGEWMDLRSLTQDLWREVAYDGLNGAVAASLTNTAVAMVKQTCIAVFAEFPDHESYDTIIQTMTRGNPDTAQGRFGLSLYRISDCGHQHEKVHDRRLDVKEHFWVHTFNDLMAFITDFQKNRTGRPTKAMQAQLNQWSPTFDLQRATNEERVSWRRLYTINWLYDLVNLFSAIVVQRNTMKGENHVYENVDWSPNGPWHEHTRLYGLNEFAGDITSFAMQKPKTDIRKKIFPHHVFQLQCVVDSFAASRGWTVSPLRGHILASPPRNFRPRRDVDLFLDREVKRDWQGVLSSIDVLKQIVQKDAEAQEGPHGYLAHVDILQEMKVDFIDWLGDTKYKHGLTTIPSSRFAKTDANGLWEYSPLLCGAGLVESLVLIQRVIMSLWDKTSEFTLILHLHNMLVQKGYLKMIGLWGTLGDLFRDTVFPRGVPTHGFGDALVTRVSKTRPDQPSQRERQAVSWDKTNDIHKIMDVNFNHFFIAKSALMMYFDADFTPDKIPDKDVQIPSMLYMSRIMNTEKVSDPATGAEQLQQTELIRRAKENGMTDAALLEAASIQLPSSSTRDEDTKSLIQNFPDLKGYTHGPRRDPFRVARDKNPEDFQGRALLDLLRVDVFHDVCGSAPLSSLNYVLVTIFVLMLCGIIENRFREARHPLWVKAYEDPQGRLMRQKRSALIMTVMLEEDDEALKLCAEAFEKCRMGIMSCIFWENLRETESGTRRSLDDEDGLAMDQCSVM